MEAEINFFTHNVVDDVMFEDQHFYVQNFNNPDPEDEDNTEAEEESDEPESSTAGDEPELDKDVVHSPVVTKPGGKPK